MSKQNYAQITQSLHADIPPIMELPWLPASCYPMPPQTHRDLGYAMDCPVEIDGVTCTAYGNIGRVSMVSFVSALLGAVCCGPKK